MRLVCFTKYSSSLYKNIIIIIYYYLSLAVSYHAHFQTIFNGKSTVFFIFFIFLFFFYFFFKHTGACLSTT